MNSYSTQVGAGQQRLVVSPTSEEAAQSINHTATTSTTTRSSSNERLTIDSEQHDNGNNQTPLRKPFKTEYKSKFTPFDQYAYNEVTDSFVKSNIVPQLSASRSNQNLDSLWSNQAPVIFEPTNSSSNSNDSRNEPWYKEVVKRNEKANEYRFKSEIGHHHPLSISQRAGSPYNQQFERGQMIQSPSGDLNVPGNSSELNVKLQHSDQAIDSAAAAPPPPYRFTPSDYKKDHLISHMANNNNFNLPREQHQPQPTAASRRVAQAGSSRPATRSAPQARSQSQSNRRQVTSTTNASSQAAKSQHTTPTKTLRATKPTATKPSATNAVAAKPKVSSTRPTKAPVSRPTTAANSRPVAASRPAASKPVVSNDVTKRVANKVSSTATSRAPVTTAATKMVAPKPVGAAPVRINKSSAIVPGKLPNGNLRSGSNTKPTGLKSNAINNTTFTKSGSTPNNNMENNAVKSVKTPKAMEAELMSPVNLLAETLSKKEDQDLGESALTPIETVSSNLIVTSTEGGNMLADEIARAEKDSAINDIAKKFEQYEQQQQREEDLQLDKLQQDQDQQEQKLQDQVQQEQRQQKQDQQQQEQHAFEVEQDKQMEIQMDNLFLESDVFADGKQSVVRNEDLMAYEPAKENGNSEAENKILLEASFNKDIDEAVKESADKHDDNDGDVNRQDDYDEVRIEKEIIQLDASQSEDSDDEHDFKIVKDEGLKQEAEKVEAHEELSMAENEDVEQVVAEQEQLTKLDDPTIGTSTNDLINGLSNGMISAEDRFDSSEREASSTNSADLMKEQTTREEHNPDDEPYSIMPTMSHRDSSGSNNGVTKMKEEDIGRSESVDEVVAELIDLDLNAETSEIDKCDKTNDFPADRSRMKRVSIDENVTEIVSKNCEHHLYEEEDEEDNYDQKVDRDDSDSDSDDLKGDDLKRREESSEESSEESKEELKEDREGEENKANVSLDNSQQLNDTLESALTSHETTIQEEENHDDDQENDVMTPNKSYIVERQLQFNESTLDYATPNSTFNHSVTRIDESLLGSSSDDDEDRGSRKKMEDDSSPNSKQQIGADESFVKYSTPNLMLETSARSEARKIDESSDEEDVNENDKLLNKQYSADSVSEPPFAAS